MAVFDTTLVSIARVLHGRTPLQGGLDHVSHRLVFVGFWVRATVCFLYGVAVALGWIALIITRSDVSTGLVLTGLLAVIALAGGLMLAFVPVYGEAGDAKASARDAPTGPDLITGTPSVTAGDWPSGATRAAIRARLVMLGYSAAGGRV